MNSEGDVIVAYKSNLTGESFSEQAICYQPVSLAQFPMMKRVGLIVFLLSAFVVVAAETADDAYIRIYNSLQQADAMNQNGQFRAAAEKYLEVQNALKRFQQINPGWNKRIIDYRLSYASERLESLVKFLPPVAPEQPAATPASPAASFQLSSRKGAAKDEADKKIDSLNNEVRRLESEKTTLEAKLKEALSVQPAAVDPVELSRAQQKITALEKERALLKVALQQEQARAAKLEQEPRPDPQALRQLESERNDLKRQLAQALAQREDVESRYQQRVNLAEAKLKQLDGLQKERDELDKKLKIIEARASVESERKPSKSELKELKKTQEAKDTAERKFYALAKELSDLQSEREKEMKAHQVALSRIRQLEEERDSLQLKLAAVNTASPGVASDAVANLQMAGELEKLRAKVAALEAKSVPFTPEELALFKKPNGSTASAYYLATRPTTKDLSPVVQKTVDEADQAFAEQRFEEAASKYEQALSKNDKSVYALANLASSQIELNKLDDAEHNLKRALSVQPNDPFSLLLLGKIKMNEDKMDEALEALSRAAELNPDSAETQNYLGIVLSEKGQRTAAEAALRRAIQIQPDYAGAHHNLAIIYATQKPPFLELARWHYDKAIALGHVKNPELEKLVAGKQ